MTDIKIIWFKTFIDLSTDVSSVTSSCDHGRWPRTHGAGQRRRNNKPPRRLPFVPIHLTHCSHFNILAFLRCLAGNCQLRGRILVCFTDISPSVDCVFNRGTESKINWREALICLLEMSPSVLWCHTLTRWHTRGSDRTGDRGSENSRGRKKKEKKQ